MTHSKSSLFLMEMIIAILFFALASTVCIQLFVKAHLISEESVNNNNAVIHAQNLAESFIATDGNLEKISELLDGDFDPDSDSNATTVDISSSNGIIRLYFDEDWDQIAPTADIKIEYCAELISYPEADGLISADISIFRFAPNDTTDTVSDKAQDIYSLSIKHHIAERRGNR